MMKIISHFELMHHIMCSLQASTEEGENRHLDDVYHWFKQQTECTRALDGKLIFIGNGGSAGICSHMATDYSKNGKMAAVCFNDGALLTCLSNDLGFEDVFLNALKIYAHSNDMLIAISSSGKSPNILRAVEYAKMQGLPVLTLSGFKPNNPLRMLGDYNIFTPSHEYGYVEISHLHFCHALLDLMIEESKHLLQINKHYLPPNLDNGVRL